jgi:translocator assembly and maintenance protein 41
LPSNLLTGVKNNFSRSSLIPPPEVEDESAYWVRLSGDDRLPVVLSEG